MVSYFNGRFLLFVFCSLIGSAVTAQSSLDVYRYNDTLKNKINAYRVNVFNQIKSGNGDSVRLNYGYETFKLSRYEQSTVDKNGFLTVGHYLDLNEIEGVYLIQRNFEGILDIIQNNGFVFSNGKRTEVIDPRERTKAGIIPRYSNSGDDSLAMQIGALVLKEIDGIKDGIGASIYSQEVKDFLNVFVDYEVVYAWNAWVWDFASVDEHQQFIDDQKQLDSIAKNEAAVFVKEYPESEFNEFINEFILREFKIKKWAIGMDPLYLGTLIPTGELADYVKIPILYANLGLRVYYKNAFINIMGGVTATGLKQDIYIDTLWTVGLTMLTGDLTLGYCFDFGKKITISPLIGVRSIANLGPKNDGKLTRFTSQVPWTFGMEFSYGGISEPYNHISPNYFRGKVRDGIGLKVMYQNPGYNEVLPELNGGLWTVTLGLNMAIFGIKKDKK